MNWKSILPGICRTISVLENWPLYFMDRLGLVRGTKVTYRLRNGLKLEMRAGTWDGKILHEIFVAKCHNPKGFEISETDTVVDIGAQIGLFSCFAALQARKGKVYSFEPSPENFAMLAHNVKLNNLRNVMAYHKAVTQKGGKISLFITDSHTGGHSIYKSAASTRKVSVEAITLAKIIEENNLRKIDFLKMDCEGAEYEILFNLPRAYFERIGRIAMEYHNLDESRNVAKLADFLGKQGYRVATDHAITALYAERI